MVPHCYTLRCAIKHPAMFQSFEDTADPTKGAARAEQLRAELAERGLDGFIVPRADEHQGEYVASYAERLHWLTGFSGSAGLAIVLESEAAIFVDGRYTLQAAQEVDTGEFKPHHVTEEPPTDWLASKIGPDMRIGIDPWLHTSNQFRHFENACARAGAVLVATEGNPIDSIWEDQPAPPSGPVVVQPLQHAGESAEEKIGAVQEALRRAGDDAVILTLPDSIAWLFNIRGNDVPHIPVSLSFAIIPADGNAILFLEPAKLDDQTTRYLEEIAELHEPANLEEDLIRASQPGRRIRVDPATAAHQITLALREGEANVTRGADPCIALKAKKNAFEIAGTRTAHKRDGLAVCRFLSWLDAEIPKGRLDEISVAKELELFRTETGKLKDIAFPSISASGPNAAMAHYRVSYQTARKLEPGSIYLIDSGAQYLDGTTDITRTVAVGDPTPEMRDRFTRVLKGHIAIATARFPEGTSGTQIDILARLPLWEVGLDYDHGTGHGVGSYLSVHEGPQRISKTGGQVPLQPGMIISNEPGYYKQGEYGIRIENLVLVRAEDDEDGDDVGRDTRSDDAADGVRMLGFETLTLAPIDLNLIDNSLLTKDEAKWLNDYHTRVFDTIGPRLKETDRDWLEKATKHIKGKA